MNKNEQEFMAEKIRTQYTEKEVTQLDELRALDAEVKRPANVFAYTFGSSGTIVMGIGMSLVMTDIGARMGDAKSMILGCIIGSVGMLMALVNYPIYKNILSSRKKNYAEQIMEISDKIINS